MKTIYPAASACLIVAFVASVGYAETLVDGVESKVVVDSANHELSTAPTMHLTYPDDRPSWIDDAPDLKSSVHRWVVTTSGCESMELCEAQLEALLPAAVALYIQETTGWTSDESLLENDLVDDRLVARRYVGTLEQGDRQLNEIAVELQFDAEIQAKIHRTVSRAMKNSVVRERVRASGGLFALALIGLCCTGGLLGIASRRYS